jgi:RNA polymerase sigma factor (sigma-70 family)
MNDVDALVRDHRKLAYYFANRMVHGTRMYEHADDMRAVALEGLAAAAKDFDPSHGYEFATFARRHIRTRLADYANANRRIFSLPNSVPRGKVYREIKATTKRLQTELGRTPTHEETAAAIGVEVRYVYDHIAFTRRVDARVSSSDDRFRENATVVLADGGLSPEELVMRDMQRETDRESVKEALRVLTDREREIIAGRFMSETRKTLRELGERFNLTRERARQIESIALAKLKRALMRAA